MSFSSLGGYYLCSTGHSHLAARQFVVELQDTMGVGTSFNFINYLKNNNNYLLSCSPKIR